MTSSPANWFSSQIFHKIYEGILNLMRVWHLCTKVLFTGTFVRTKVLLDASKVRRYEGTTL